MIGMDPGALAQALIAYFGSSGGYIAAAGGVVVFLLWACQVLSGRHALEFFMGVCGAWGIAYIIHNVIGWA